MTERGLQIRTGINKQGWEESDFPILCENCLGPNPYIRMLRDRFGRECGICSRPYTVFKWKPGKDYRQKLTEICQTCGKLKNVCQSCLRDLEFNLTMTSRDRLLGDERVEVPEFEANRDYWAEQANRNLDRLQLPYDKPLPVIESLLKEPRLKQLDEVNEAIENFENNATNTGSVMDLMKAEEFKPKGLLPPEDPKISSLYISHMTQDIREIDIRRVFGKYGKVDSVKIMPHGQSCFVNFASRKAAENAVNELYSSLKIKELELKVQWARGPNKRITVGNILKSIKPEMGVQEQTLFQTPLPPNMPPPDITKTNQIENEFLQNLLTSSSGIYPSMDPYQTLGGVSKGAGQQQTLKNQEI